MSFGDRAFGILERKRRGGGIVRRMKAECVIREEAAAILQRIDEKLAAFLTVSRVALSSDFECADVFLIHNMPMSESDKQEVMQILDDLRGVLQSRVITMVGLKRMRRVSFRIDPYQQRAQQVCELLDRVTGSE